MSKVAEYVQTGFNEPLKIEGTKVMVPDIDGLEDRTAYNGVLYVDNGRLLALVRTEPVDSEVSTVCRVEWNLNGSYPNYGRPSINGLKIPYLQDPCIGNVLGVLTIQGVKIFPDEMGMVTGYTGVIYPLNGDEEGAVYGLPQDKYIRGVDKSDGQFILTRDRDELSDGSVACNVRCDRITVQHPQDIVKELKRIKDDPSTIVEGVIPADKKNTWVGIGSLYPLMKGIGVVGHYANYGAKCDNGERARNYTTVVWEHNDDGSCNRPVQPIISSSLFSRSYPPKRPDLYDVALGYSLTFGVDERGIIVDTIVAGGLRDRHFFVARIRYPFSTPPDPDYNQHSMIKASELPRYFPQLY